MKCLVTGAAGFIGSHLAEELLRHGHEVVGLDALIPYYPAAIKERNEAAALRAAGYRSCRLDLRRDGLDEVVRDVDVVFHLAAMPGLSQSWTDFDGYWTCNVQATFRLLEAVIRAAGQLRSFVHVSTSSVYGRFSSGDESLPLKPISPYGVTKLAAENLCRAFREAHGLPLTVLRFFSVYGPRQRPDMAYHRFMEAVRQGQPIIVYGDGQQVRGNTYVADCVAATIASLEGPMGETYNVGGGEAVTVLEIVQKLEAITKQTIRVRYEPVRPGDQRYTFADTSKLRSHTGWLPQVGLDTGLAEQWAWHQQSVMR